MKKLNAQERRIKRQERREQQRKQNTGRALKMHEARLADKIDYESRESPPHLAKHFYVGCSGWFYWHWRDIFYPAALPTNQWFAHYASNFDTVELNAPFYSWPTVGTIQSWIRQKGRKRLVYTVKVNEMITHTKRFARTKQLVEDFGYIADILGKNMGCFLYQLPPSYHYTPAKLKTILGQMDNSRRNVVEFRHVSWWNEKVYAAFRKANVIFCSCSGPKLPDELIKTSDEIYIRFHGKEKWYRHDYSPEELAVWVKRIHDSGAARVWAYFNNDRDGHAIKNAKNLLRLLKS